MKLMSQPTLVVWGSRSATSRSAPMRSTPPGLAAPALAAGACDGTGTAAPEVLAAGEAAAGFCDAAVAGARDGAADGAGAQACRASAKATMSAGIFRADVRFISTSLLSQQLGAGYEARYHGCRSGVNGNCHKARHGRIVHFRYPV